MRKIGLTNDKYRVDELRKESDGSLTIVLMEQYEGFLLYDNTCKITFSERGIRRIDYKKLQVKGFTPEKVAHIEAYQALLAYFESGSNVTISSIDNGYKLDETGLEGMESIELLPTWRIGIKDGRPVFISSHNTDE